MRIEELDSKTVAIIGFGQEGRASLRALQAWAPEAKVVIHDRQSVEISGVELKTRESYLSNLQDCDVIIKSPGVVFTPELEEVRQKITNSTQIFLDTVKARKAQVIGVTGSKGKSTVASLIFAILQAAKLSVYLVGNIGKASLDYLEFAEEGVVFVMEMSSYQLAECTSSPQVAVLTSFFPEHLDYHGSLQNYWAAKSTITRYQNLHDTVVFNRDFAECESMAAISMGIKLAVSAEEYRFTEFEIQLKGRHNLANVALATKVAEYFKVPMEVIEKVVKAFKPLPHRLEMLGEYGGIYWVDDAISTTPESTIAALDTLGTTVTTIILGGTDRGYDFKALAERIRKSNIKNCIFFPESGARIRLEIENVIKSMKMYDASSMQAAVEWAYKNTKKGETCLLSTASPSYSLFKNFVDKGDQFATWIKKGVQ